MSEQTTVVDFKEFVEAEPDDEYWDGEPSYNTNYVLDVRGERYWTDRYVLLPAHLSPPVPNSEPLPVSTASAEKWLESAATRNLGEPTQGFDPRLAGPLTRAGFVARSIANENKMHALVLDGQPIGIIMPMLMPTARKGQPVVDKRVALPCSPALLDWHDRIRSEGLANSGRQSWALAEFCARTESERTS